MEFRIKQIIKYLTIAMPVVFLAAACNKVQPAQNQPQNQISDWKTYTNYKYGFEIKYPPQWTVFENTSFKTESPFDGVTIGLPLTNNSLNVFMQFTITNKSQAAAEAEAEQIGKYLSDRQIGAKTAKLFEINANVYPSTKQWALALPRDKNSTIGVLYGYAVKNIPNEIKLEQTFSDALSTLKFVSSSVDMGGWKKYNNEQLGIQFNYPSDWIVKDSSSVSNGLNVFLEEEKYANDATWPFGLSVADATRTNLGDAKNKKVFEEQDKHNTNFVENVISIYFQEGAKTYISECKADINICNQIISTFKANN